MRPSPGLNAALYVSPPVSERSTHAWVPGFGGSTSTVRNLPLTTTLIEKVPLDVVLIWADLTAPFSPFESLYLKPLTASPLQNGFPVMPLVPCGSGNVCVEGVPPPAEMVTEPPATL